MRYAPARLPLLKMRGRFRFMTLRYGRPTLAQHLRRVEPTCDRYHNMRGGVVSLPLAALSA